MVLAHLDLVRVNDRVLGVAGLLRPAHLRSLDAIHLATALELRPELSAVVAYDARLAAAARELGFRVIQPA